MICFWALFLIVVLGFNFFSNFCCSIKFSTFYFYYLYFSSTIFFSLKELDLKTFNSPFLSLSSIINWDIVICSNLLSFVSFIGVFCYTKALIPKLLGIFYSFYIKFRMNYIYFSYCWEYLKIFQIDGRVYSQLMIPAIIDQLEFCINIILRWWSAIANRFPTRDDRI